MASDIPRPAHPPLPSPGNRPPRPGRLIAVGAGGFTAFVNLYALQSLLPTLAREFQASRQAVSLTISATTLAVAIASPFCGWLVARFPRRPVTGLAVVGLVGAGLQTAYVHSLAALDLWRFIQGLFLPMLVAGIIAFISEDWPEQQVGRVMSGYVTWTVIGGFLGRLIGGLVAAGGNWRQALWALALVNGVAGLTLWLCLPERRQSAERRKDPERERKERRKSDQAGSLPTREGLVSVLSNPHLRVAYAAGFNVLFTLVGLFTYVTFHLSEPPFDLGPGELGKIFCVYLLGVVVTPAVGRALPVLGFRRTQRRATLIAMAGLGLTLLANLPLVILGLALCCSATFVSQATTSAYVGKQGGRHRALAIGLYLSFYYFGGCVGAVIPGLVWTVSGWSGCVFLLLAFQVVTYALAGKYR